jgi:hypothetical protein
MKKAVITLDRNSLGLAELWLINSHYRTSMIESVTISDALTLLLALSNFIGKSETLGLAVDPQKIKQVIDQYLQSTNNRQG